MSDIFAEDWTSLDSYKDEFLYDIKGVFLWLDSLESGSVLSCVYIGGGMGFLPDANMPSKNAESRFPNLYDFSSYK